MRLDTKKLPTKTRSEPAPLHIMSEDPDVQAIQGMLKGLAHFNRKSMSLRHVKVFMAVEMLIRVTKGRAYPNRSMIGQAIGVKNEHFRDVLADLVAARYLHEELPRYGGAGKSEEDIMTYKLGSMGGTIMRQIMPKAPDKRAA